MRSYDKHSHNSARAYCEMLTIQGAVLRTGRDGNFITINPSCGVSENEEARIIIAHDHGAPARAHFCLVKRITLSLMDFQILMKIQSSNTCVIKNLIQKNLMKMARTIVEHLLLSSLRNRFPIRVRFPKMKCETDLMRWSCFS